VCDEHNIHVLKCPVQDMTRCLTGAAAAKKPSEEFGSCPKPVIARGGTNRSSGQVETRLFREVELGVGLVDQYPTGLNYPNATSQRSGAKGREKVTHSCFQYRQSVVGRQPDHYYAGCAVRREAPDVREVKV
jgi:hypothetical protein